MPLGKAAGLGTERVLPRPAALSHVWAAAPLFLTAKNQLALSAYFKGPAFSRGAAHANYIRQSLSFCLMFSVHTHLYIAVSSLHVSLRGPHYPDPNNLFL